MSSWPSLRRVTDDLVFRTQQGVELPGCNAHFGRASHACRDRCRCRGPPVASQTWSTSIFLSRGTSLRANLALILLSLAQRATKESTTARIASRPPSRSCNGVISVTSSPCSCLTTRSKTTEAIRSLRRSPRRPQVSGSRTRSAATQVAALCERLYGDHESPHYVYGDQERDTLTPPRTAPGYATPTGRAGEPIPRRLMHNGGNVITVRRALSIAYGPKSRFLASFATCRTGDGYQTCWRGRRPCCAAGPARLGLAAPRTA
jgi:hypothetical protein